MAAALALATADRAGAAVREARNAQELQAAIEQALPGDRIVLAPGRYRLPLMRIARPGTASDPITLTVAKPDETVLEPLESTLLQVRAPHWIFEALDMLGTDESEHAFHLIGDASGTVIRRNRLRNFDSALKANGGGEAGLRRFPNDVLVEGNAIWNERPRVALRPTNPIDVVGGRNWLLSGNFVADFAHVDGKRPAYGMYLKGNSKAGRMEGNLVICEWRHAGGTRIGISFGGGGTGRRFCEAEDCSTEHADGIMRNNIISNCPEDVGIYLNKAKNIIIAHNTLMNTNGIAVRFDTSSARILNNIVLGRITSRNDGLVMPVDNLELGPWLSMIGMRMGAASHLFQAPELLDLRLKDPKPVVDLAVSPAEPSTDFCGRQRRRPRTDLGAIDFANGPCDVAAWHKRMSDAPWRR